MLGKMRTCSVHEPFLIEGSRLFIHRSLHCLPVRPCRAAATTDHCLVPYLFTCAARVSLDKNKRRAPKMRHSADRSEAG